MFSTIFSISPYESLAIVLIVIVAISSIRNWRSNEVFVVFMCIGFLFVPAINESVAYLMRQFMSDGDDSLSRVASLYIGGTGGVFVAYDMLDFLCEDEPNL